MFCVKRPRVSVKIGVRLASFKRPHFVERLRIERLLKAVVHEARQGTQPHRLGPSLGRADEAIE
jgi:hypothetical protein